jgi:hypothetical protein
MIVQKRHSETRLISQHDHGILSGQFAARWVEPETEERLDDVLILTAELHDYAWTDIDRSIRHWREPDQPADFLTYPEDEKLVIYQRGIEELGQMHPYAGLLLSYHYTAFTSEERAPMFIKRQKAMREQFRQDCRDRGFDPSNAEKDFELLKLLDVLSLIICVTPPGSDEEYWPFWLNPSHLLEKFNFETKWKNGSLQIDPFPFDQVIETQVPYRTLDATDRKERPIYLEELDAGLQDVRVEPY